MCSSILKSGTYTKTATATVGTTTTVKTTVIVTLYPPTTSPGRPTTTTKGPTTSSSSTVPPTTSSSTTQIQTPTPTPSAACGIVGYTKDTAAYYFDSSGTKNTFTACRAACRADSQCKSFGYGEANCMLFNVDATSNTNINPMSPYTFYDASCPTELPVKKRQVSIGFGISSLSSACSCLITSAPGQITKTTSVTVTNKATATQTVTRTVSLLPDGGARTI